jgi:hypothetical protein
MNNPFKKLSLIGIMGITVIGLLSCSKEEVNPLQQYFGVYDCYTGSIPGPDNNGNFPVRGPRLVIREAPNSKVKFEIYEPGLTYPNEKITTLSDCEIVSLDTTGNKYRYFAQINTKDKVEIGKVRLWTYGGAFGKQLETRFYIPMDFMIEPNRRIAFYAMKRKD